MTRVVPGWLWLQGAEVQALEWKALRDDFWRYVNLNLWEMAVVRKWKVVNEIAGEVTLHMEADIVGKIVPGSLRISVDT
jgi:hypothetical protein